MTRFLGCLALALAILFCAPRLAAQRKVDVRNRYHRLVAVVPMVGKGTRADPRRPLYAPWPPAVNRAAAIIAWTHVPSDDGKSALVEFVARSRAAFAPILADKSPSVKAFEKGIARKDDIEKELKKHRKDFDLSKFGAALP